MIKFVLTLWQIILTTFSLYFKLNDKNFKKNTYLKVNMMLKVLFFKQLNFLKKKENTLLQNKNIKYK